MNSKTRKPAWLPFLLTFTLAVAFRSLLYLQSYSEALRTDDFGPLIYPAYLAGKNWRAFTGNIYNYYGYGYYWIMFPLYWIANNGIELVKYVSVVNTVMIGLCSVLIYHIGMRYLKLSSKPLAIFLAVLATCFISDGDTISFARIYNTDNEVPMFLICWLMVWILLKAYYDQKASRRVRLLEGAGAALILVWSLTVHERAMALCLAVIIAELLIALFYRKWILHPLTFFGVFIAGYPLQRLLRNAIRHYVFYLRTYMSNSSAFSNVSLWFLQSKQHLKAFLVLIIGNLHNLMTKGYAFPFLACAILLVWFIRNLISILKSLKTKSLKKQSEKKERGEISPSVLVMLVFMLTALIVITGLGFRWGEKLADCFIENKIGHGYKGITYTRYYYVFLGPVIMAVVAWLATFRGGSMCMESVDGKLPVRLAAGKMIAISWIIFLGLEGVFMKLVFPCVNNADYFRRALAYYFGTSLTYSQRMWITLGMTALFLLLITAVLLNCRKILLILPISILLLIGYRRVLFADPANASFTLKKSKGMYGMLDEMKASETGLPDKIFVSLQNEWTFSYTVRMYDFDQYVTYGLPDEESEQQGSCIVITNYESEDLVNRGYEMAIVSKYYVYTKSEGLTDILKNYQ